MSGTEEGLPECLLSNNQPPCLEGQKKPEDCQPLGASRLLISRENCYLMESRKVPLQETAKRDHTEHSQNPGAPRPVRTRPFDLKHLTSILFYFYYILT